MIAESAREYSEQYWRSIVLDLPPDAIIEWHLGDTSESCQSCIGMSEFGALTAEEFVTLDIYPQANELDCHGYNCRCFLVVVDEVSTDDLITPLGSRVSSGGDEGLAQLYAQVQVRLQAQDYRSEGLTHASLGRSWFDATASSSGSFTGARYGDTMAAQFDRMLSPQYPSGTLEGGWSKLNTNSTFTAPSSSRGSFTGDRYTGGETWGLTPPTPMQGVGVTMGELQWLEEPVREPSSFEAPSSSRGSFTGERYDG